MVVHKYKLNHGLNLLNLPSGSMPLKVAFQSGEIVIWLLIPAGSISNDVLRFWIVFTGEEFKSDGPVTYISSDENDGIVFHAFELN